VADASTIDDVVVSASHSPAVACVAPSVALRSVSFSPNESLNRSIGRSKKRLSASAQRRALGTPSGQAERAAAVPNGASPTSGGLGASWRRGQYLYRGQSQAGTAGSASPSVHRVADGQEDVSGSAQQTHTPGASTTHGGDGVTPTTAGGTSKRRVLKKVVRKRRRTQSRSARSKSPRILSSGLSCTREDF
jgi:hypothetical protein